jgi:2-amino-4-hydroxy-6-hydroxymethyldihydropteridine diphosphokinase
MSVVFIGVGSNLGNRENYIRKAINRLEETAGITVDKVSSIIESEPLNAPAQGKFLNAVIKLETNLSAQTLLEELQAIEKDLGRTRPFKNAPRTIDLDIILYGEEEINNPGLTVPHPRMFERPFVIKPLLELEPSFEDKLIRYGYHRKHQ